MPKWYFSKEKLISRTPSRANGVDFATETRYRREGCRFIMDMGNKLGLRYDTMATGVIYYHRFYMKQSFKTFPRWVTACACLFLAGKVEETPKKCRDIIKVAKCMLSDHHFQLFGENPREEVMMYERVLLQTIKFDLQVDHPYGILLKIGKLLKGDRGKVQKLVQMAWTFVNDSLATNLCIRAKPEILAIAHLNLAGKLANFDLKSSIDSPSNKPWWLVFNKDCSETVVEEICNEMLELYGGKKKEKQLKPKEKLHGSEKGEPSPNTSSNTSSPSVTNSPPFKKQRVTSSTSKSTDVAKLASTASTNKDHVDSIPKAPVTGSQPIMTIPSVTASSFVEPPLVENVSPAIVSDSLPIPSIIASSTTRTIVYPPTISSSIPSNRALPIPSQPPPLLGGTTYINTSVPPPPLTANTFLSAPSIVYPVATYGMIPQGHTTDTCIPHSTPTSTSYMPRVPPVIDPSMYPPSAPLPLTVQNPISYPPAQNLTSYPPTMQKPITSYPPTVQKPITSYPPVQKPTYGQPYTNIPPPLLSTHQPPPRPMYPTHHQLPPQQTPPLNVPMPPHMMSNQIPPGSGASQNWHSPYNRPPHNNPPRGGWM